MKAKVYRFEAMEQSNNTAEAIPRETSDLKHNEIMAELTQLRAHICPPALEGVGPSPVRLNSNLSEALKLKAELDQIYHAIAQTKHEIASISSINLESNTTRPVDELDAVVYGTEVATNQILTAVESVESNANTLANNLTGDAGLMAANIQEQVISIYEACNFQDITGQRIAKVVQVLRFISERTDRMIEIWGGIDSFNDVPSDQEDNRKGDEKLLNGPALEDDEAVASQDDIDALFA